MAKTAIGSISCQLRLAETVSHHSEKKKMKIIAFLFSILVANSLAGKCAMNGLAIYPQTEKISKNSLIIVEGFHNSVSIVKSLNDDYPIYLQSSDDTVELEVERVNIGMVGLAQAILRPEKDLKAGGNYELIIENLNDKIIQSSNYLKWNSKTKKREPISWIVNNSSDYNNPILQKNPELFKSHYTKYGCGPAIFAEFSMSVEDDSQIWAKIEFLDLESKECHFYYLPLDNKDSLKIGRGMCSGPFNYNRNKKYKVRFSFMDECGNSDEKWTEWIEYESPV